MQPNLRLLIIFLLLSRSGIAQQQPNPYPTIVSIPVPAGYHRIPAPAHSFAAWLRNIPLKRDRTVYLFNGVRKANQNAQFAVLDVSVGNSLTAALIPSKNSCFPCLRSPIFLPATS